MIIKEVVNIIKSINYNDLKRRSKNLSAYTLANKMCTTPNTVYHVFNEHNDMRIGTFIKLLNALDYHGNDIKNAFIFN